VDIRDKSVIVTGASRGIGREIAVELGRRGARVAVAARTAEPRRILPGTIAETVQLIDEAGGTGLGVQCDVTKPEDLERLVAVTVETFGRLDVVVNNAADMAGQDLEDLVATMLGQPDPEIQAARPTPSPFDNWLTQFATNVHAPYLLTGLAVPHLRRQGGGVIINMSSGVATMTTIEDSKSLPRGERPGLGYATTKAALNRLTNASAAELASDNIAVVAVDPGETRTELIDLLGEGGLLDPENRVPMAVPAKTVLDIITADDPLHFSGQIVQTRPA